MWLRPLRIGIPLLLACQLAHAQATKPAQKGLALTVRARVVSVQREAYPEALLVLEPMGTESIPKGTLPERILARAYLLRTQGRVRVFTVPDNITGAQAYYLLPGDVVQGSLVSPKGGKVWTLRDLKRANLSPPRPKAASSVRLELSTDATEYSTGTPIRLLLAVTNVGRDAVTLSHPSGQHYDFSVRAQGREVWRWSAGRAFTTALSTTQIAPGETVTFSEVWGQRDSSGEPVQPGTYEVQGWLNATGQLALTQSSAEIQIRGAKASTPPRATRPRAPAPAAQAPTSPVTNIDDIAARSRTFTNRVVTLEGSFQGQEGSSRDPLLRGGQPLSRKDWVLEDASGGIWANGDGGLMMDPTRDLGMRLRVEGIVRRTATGRVYLKVWEVHRLADAQ
ncbi:MAG TPA: BsuPI-related putative proteinase inhibitor [Armatimonadota bacterium]|jgi:hypothetical protein